MRRFFRWIYGIFRGSPPVESPKPKEDLLAKQVEVVDLFPEHPGGLHPRFKIKNLDTLGERDRERLREAKALLNYILAHPSTRDRWMSYELIETNGKSNAQIWDEWIKGDQLGQGDEIGVTDVSLIMYHNRFSRVVGYTYLESLFVWINRKFFGDRASIASNLAHEAMGHQYGYTHTMSPSSATVPWRLNQLVEEQYEFLRMREMKF